MVPGAGGLAVDGHADPFRVGGAEDEGSHAKLQLGGLLQSAQHQGVFRGFHGDLGGCAEVARDQAAELLHVFQEDGIVSFFGLGLEQGS